MTLSRLVRHANRVDFACDTIQLLTIEALDIM